MHVVLIEPERSEDSRPDVELVENLKRNIALVQID
jgi:hypothetical protein